MAKRLSEKQKKEIIQGFKDAKTIDFLSKKFNCTKLTIIRNLKANLGEEIYKRLLKSNNKLNKKDILHETKNKKDLESTNLKEDLSEEKFFNITPDENDFYPDLSFLEISPVNIDIDNTSRKELSSVSIKDIDLPKIVFMIVDKKIELEIKLLKDFPEWKFLPVDDLNRKTIEIFFDLKIAKRFCNKDQKVIKVPNTNIFKIAAPMLLSKGISRIVCPEALIAL